MVAVISILYLGFNYLKGIDFFSNNTKYYVIYQNVSGLNVSNPVTINGFSVGRVSDITLDQDANNEVIVELDISEKVILGDSATATLSSDFLGNKSILLSTGDISQPIFPGDTIVAVVDKGITELLTESAQPVATSLESTIKKINAILDNLSGNSGKINRIMDRLETTSVLLNATISDTRENLNKMSGTWITVGENMNTTLADARPTLKNLTVFTDSLKALEMKKTLAEVNNTLQSLNEAIEKFSTNEGTLGKLMNDDSLYVNLNKAAESLDELLNHIDDQPKHFFAPLGKSKEKIERDRRKAREEEEEEQND
jgi:phospholipid/cholesterol/gamma-HCH transport system substrate-binding protein